MSFSLIRTKEKVHPSKVRGARPEVSGNGIVKNSQFFCKYHSNLPLECLV